MPTTLRIPCSSKIQCDDLPLANLSSESPDQEVFTSVYFPPIEPPLNRVWTGSACQVTCTSTISQEAADICALQRAAICDATPPDPPPPPPVICTTPGGCTFTPEPPYFPPTYPPDPPTSIPCNTAQTCCKTCPDGQEYCYTVPACTFYGQTVAVANAIALSYACKRVEENIVCATGSAADCCVGASYAGSFSVSGGTTPFTWSLTGNPPPGMVLTPSGDTRSVGLSGPATVAGAYEFAIRAQDANGNFSQRNLQVSVVEITSGSLPAATIGVAYAVQLTVAGGAPPYTWAVSSGALPLGLTLTPGGLLSGTPTTDGTSSFTISVTDSSA